MKTETAFYRSPLGFLSITAEETDIISVLFTDDVPSSQQEVTSTVIIECMRQLDEYFAGTLRKFTVPLKPQGTLFRQKVWQKLQEVEFGRTMSYHKLSAITGNTKAIRAVALSNGKNPIAIIIPCHRIIGSDGSLTGYAGGLWRKQWLLDHELTIAGRQLSLQW